MYTPPHFSETDQQRIENFIDANGFATLITTVAGEVLVSHAPVQFDPARNVLIGHLARANGQAENFKDGDSLLAIFHGPHGYISPTWYVNENAKSPNVPTWNYAAVHVTGKVRRLDAPEDIWHIVTALSAKYESGKPADMPRWDHGQLADHVHQLHALVGFEVAITNVQAKFKLSQNRSVADQKGAIKSLAASGFSGDLLLADLMREQLKN